MDKELSLDFDWLFFKGDLKGAQEVEFDDSSWKSINVPHDWSIEGPFNEQEPSGRSGGFLPTGVGWYRKKFKFQELVTGKKVYIYFDGVYHNSEVWCNGHYIGKRPNGYVGFFYDLTSYIHEDENNVIAVRVDNSDQPNCRWYSGSGIYRHVWLTICDPLHIDKWGTYITTPNISDKKAKVQISTKVTNHHSASKSFTLETIIIDKVGQQVAKQLEDVMLNPEETSTFTQKLDIQNPQLWSTDSPNLYTALTRLTENGLVIDEYHTPFGIRKITFTSNEGMTVNGESVKLKGINMHHDAGSVGAAVPERILESRLKTLKEIGCNAIRCSHNPPAQELLDLCDQMGFFVIDEAFDRWWDERYGYGELFKEWWKEDLEAMILRDRNHPSIIMWSVGNEVEEQSSQRSVDTLKMLVNHVHKIEPTRPVTCAMRPPVEYDSLEEKIDAIMKMAEHMDIVSLNYQEQWYDALKKRNPNIIIIGGETYPFFRGNEFSHKGFEPINTWFDVVENDNVIGQFIWPGVDYLGESIKWPGKGRVSCIVNSYGFRKPLSYFHQSVWKEEPMVHIAAFDDSIKQPLVKLHWNAPKMASHWTFPHFEDQLIKIVTFTNCEKVELFVNDDNKGFKYLSDFPDRLMTWYLPYEPGTIKAVGYRGDQIVSTHEMQTTGVPNRIQLNQDRTIINTDSRDISLIEVTITDENGNCYPYAENEITFEIKGEGKIIGVDNGNFDSDEPFKGEKRSAYHGKCFVIVQSNHNAGSIELQAHSAGLHSAKININTVKEKSTF